MNETYKLKKPHEIKSNLTDRAVKYEFYKDFKGFLRLIRSKETSTGKKENITINRMYTHDTEVKYQDIIVDKNGKRYVVKSISYEKSLYTDLLFYQVDLEEEGLYEY